MGAGPPIRNAARVVVVDETGRVLLFRGCSQEWDPPRVAWYMPGGGLEAGETHEEAALRELEEEGRPHWRGTGAVRLDQTDDTPCVEAD